MESATDAKLTQSGGSGVAKDWLRALEMTGRIAAQPARTLADVVDELAQTQGDAPALLSHDARLDYRALAGRANRYARWALQQNVAKGDVVCLLMPNCPEYLAIWPVNSSARSQSLATLRSPSDAGLASVPDSIG